jgi:hypothetical protein
MLQLWFGTAIAAYSAQMAQNGGSRVIIMRSVITFCEIDDGIQADVRCWL